MAITCYAKCKQGDSVSSTKYVIIVFALMIACVAHAAQSSKRSFQTAYCMQYEQAQDTVDVETLPHT